MIHLLVTGANGQLGRCLKDALANQKEISATFIDINDLDLTESEAVNRYFENKQLDILINCAAYTAVDSAEIEADTAMSINRNAVANIAKAGADNGFRVIHISTDYVFDGEKGEPYTENDTTNPLTVYGQSKSDGEKILQRLLPESIIIRTAWLYSRYGKNFFLTMKRKALNKEDAKVVDDQKGTPTNADDLANTIIKIIKFPEWIPGIYHYTNQGSTTWFDFTKEIYRLFNADSEKVTPIKTDDLDCLAKRPKNSTLDKQKIKDTFNITIPDWKESLRKMSDL